jgi:hypothetical protein
MVGPLDDDDACVPPTPLRMFLSFLDKTEAKRPTSSKFIIPGPPKRIWAKEKVPPAGSKYPFFATLDMAFTPSKYQFVSPVSERHENRTWCHLPSNKSAI